MSHIHDWEWSQQFKEAENTFKELYELYNKNQIKDKYAIKNKILGLQEEIGGLQDDLKSEMYLVCHGLLKKVFPRFRNNEEGNITKIIQDIEDKIIGKAYIEQLKDKKQKGESNIALEIEKNKESERREKLDQLSQQVEDLEKSVQDLSI